MVLRERIVYAVRRSKNPLRQVSVVSIHKCGFLRKAKENKGLCGSVHLVRRTFLMQI